MTIREASVDVEAPTPTPSIAVVTAVADAKGVDPMELDPLANAVDPEALDRLFASMRDGRLRTEGRLRFELAGCEVTLASDGTVTASPVDAENESK